MSDFIFELARTDEYISKIYTEGGCYRFSRLLCKMFQGAKTWISLAEDDEHGYHAITEYQGKFFDINGVVDKQVVSKFFHELVDKNEIAIAESWSFSKKHNIERIGAY